MNEKGVKGVKLTDNMTEETPKPWVFLIARAK